MIGNNTIQLNHATMAAALQHYFETIVFKDGKKIKVVAVKEVGNNCFAINLSEVEPKASV